MMPDMNGLQVLRRLKADRRLRTIPVVMISGLRETDSVIRCIGFRCVERGAVSG
jgi:CheY-like chemotaxis protein